MFILYKLRASIDKSQDMLRDLFATYATHYVELISCSTDLVAYAPLLTKDSRESIMEQLHKLPPNENEVREARK